LGWWNFIDFGQTRPTTEESTMTTCAKLLWFTCSLPFAKGMSSEIWAIVGDCEIDQEDPDCIATRNFPHYYGTYDNCAVRFSINETRLLQVMAFDIDPAESFFGVINGTSGKLKNYSNDNIEALQGLAVNRDTALVWNVSLGLGRLGWRICARALDRWDLLNLTGIDNPETTSTSWMYQHEWQRPSEIESMRQHRREEDVLHRRIMIWLGVVVALFVAVPICAWAKCCCFGWQAQDVKVSQPVGSSTGALTGARAQVMPSIAESHSDGRSDTDSTGLATGIDEREESRADCV